MEAGYAEALQIGREADLPVHTYHLKAAGQRNWHKMPALIETINKGARGGSGHYVRHVSLCRRGNGADFGLATVGHGRGQAL